MSVADIFETSVRERVVQMKARIVRGRVTVPMIAVNVLASVHATVGRVFHLGRGGALATWGCWRCMASIAGMLVLREQGHCGSEQ
jgi:hypothetical protein